MENPKKPQEMGENFQKRKKEKEKSGVLAVLSLNLELLTAKNILI